MQIRNFSEIAKKLPKKNSKNEAKMKKTEKPTSKKEREIVPILGIGVDSTYKERALNRAWELGRGGDKEDRGDKEKKPKLIVTPNPEIILSGYKNKSQARILNKADLAVPDGIGVVLAMRYLRMRKIGGIKGMGRPITLFFQGIWVGLSLFINRKWLFEVSEVVPGRWLFEELVQKSAKEGKRVFLLGGKLGVAEKAASALNIKYPWPRQAKRGGQISNIKYNTGPWLDNNGEPVSKTETGKETEVIKQINAFKPHFLFVGFGCPKQEKWLDRSLAKLNVGAAMTVGGAFDYLAGEVPEPPARLTEAGLEWLWRLLTQPWRIRRIFTAVVMFPLKLYLDRAGRQV